MMGIILEIERQPFGGANRLLEKDRKGSISFYTPVSISLYLFTFSRVSITYRDQICLIFQLM